MNIGIIGAGNIGKALLARLSKYKLLVSSGHPGSFEGIPIITDNCEVAAQSDIILLVVKPQIMGNILDEIKEVVNNKLIITFAAGLPIAFYEKKVNARVAWAIPTIAIKKGTGLTNFALSAKCTAEDRKHVEKILSHLGMFIEVTEEEMDAACSVSGSGIAYLTKIVDIFMTTAESNNIEREKAKQIMLQTLRGAVSLLESEDAQQIITEVACKGGVTEQGLKELQEKKIDEILTSTIQKSIDKCRNFREQYGR